jgi:hypothetical protein
LVGVLHVAQVFGEDDVAILVGRLDLVAISLEQLPPL